MPRLNELDFLKCVFILFMVTFHLTFVSATFPVAKQMVYTFHMPCFLLLSGYLMNINKNATAFARMLWRFFLPYIIMESGYVYMASLLPINEHIDGLTLSVFFDKLFLHPIGPYWYLQTLILCSVVYYVVMRLLRIPIFIKALCAVFACYLLSEGGVVSFACTMYFFVGVVIRQLNFSPIDVFRPMAISIIPLVYLLCNAENHDKGVIGGMLIVYFVMSLCLWIYRFLPHSSAEALLKIGRNTMSIYLFSPIFTILVKPLAGLIPCTISTPLRAVLFMIVALPICIAGSMVVGKIVNATKIMKV